MSDKARNTAVDTAKLIAAFGVISLHVKADTPAANGFNIFFWPLCVPFFFVVSLTYFIPSFQKSTVSSVFKKTWSRIIIPYFAWTTIYVSLFLLKKLIVGGTHYKFILYQVIFYGGSGVQMYYLPTLLLFQAIAFSIYLIISGPPKQRMIGLIMFGFCALYFAFGDYHNCFGVAATGEIIGIILYIWVAYWMSGKIKNNSFNVRYIISGVALIIFAVVCNFLGQGFIIGEYPLLLPIGGIGVLLLTFGLKKYKVSEWYINLASLSFGIYLSHVIFLELFEFAIKKLHLTGFRYDFLTKLIVVVILFVISAAFTLLLKNISFTRKFLLGEKNQSF